MKTLFLFALLFILVAFAFKEPNQSAWDFARNVGSSVSGKVASGEKDKIKKIQKPRGETAKKFDLQALEKSLNRAKKLSEPKTKNYSNAKTKPTIKTYPKPRPRVKSKSKLVKKLRPSKSVNTELAEETISPNVSLEPLPDIEAKPISKVAREDLSPPRAETLSRPAYRPINVDELAEMGRRYDRASRLLSEIK